MDQQIYTALKELDEKLKDFKTTYPRSRYDKIEEDVKLLRDSVIDLGNSLQTTLQTMITQNNRMKVLAIQWIDNHPPQSSWDWNQFIINTPILSMSSHTLFPSDSKLGQIKELLRNEDDNSLSYYNKLQHDDDVDKVIISYVLAILPPSILKEDTVESIIPSVEKEVEKEKEPEEEPEPEKEKETKKRRKRKHN
jgi:hypothetical protein